MEENSKKTAYRITKTDDEIIQATKALLRKAVRFPNVTAAQISSAAKLLFSFESLPQCPAQHEITLTVTPPRRRYGQVETYYWWEVRQSGTSLSVSSGGHYYHPRTGGDSFSVFDWLLTTGSQGSEYYDYREHHSVVPDLDEYDAAVAKIDSAEEGYRIDLDDADNFMLNDNEEESGPTGDGVENAKEERPYWGLYPVTMAERKILVGLDCAAVDLHEPAFADGIVECGRCGCYLPDRGLAIDGRLNGRLIWGYFCVECYADVGVGLGPGNGQLYARQENGEWRMVAGFDD